MKKYTTKRVLAGVLAVMTVAGYAPANVGGLLALTNTAITASAADTYLATFENRVAPSIQSATDGTNTADNATITNIGQYRFVQNKVVTIKSSVRLVINQGGTALIQADDGSTTNPKPLPLTTDLTTLTNGANLYLMEKTNGVYTYKFLMDAATTIDGVGQLAKVHNVDMTKTAAETANLKLSDGTPIECTALDLTSNIVKLNGETVSFTSGEATYATESTAPIIKDGKATFKFPKAFKVYTNIKPTGSTGSPSTVSAPSVYNNDDKAFVCTVDIPEVDDANFELNFYLSAVKPEYTFKNNGTSLTASSKDGATTNAVVASIKATAMEPVKYKTSSNTIDYHYVDSADLATQGSVVYGSRVELEFTNDETGEITTANDSKQYVLKITKNGKELLDTDYVNASSTWSATPTYDSNAKTYGDIKNGATGTFVPNGSAAGKLAFNQAGEYVVEYTVFAKTVNSQGITVPEVQTLTYKFTIKNKTALTAYNVELTAKGQSKTGILKDENSNNEVKVVGIQDGVVEIEVSDTWKAGDIISITPTIYEDEELQRALNAGGNSAGVPKAVGGNLAPSTLDSVNTLTIKYENADYGAGEQTITLKYKLVAPKKKAVVTPDGDYVNFNLPSFDTSTITSYSGGMSYTDPKWFTANPYMSTTVDKLASLQDDIFNAIIIENVDEDDVSFEYATGYDVTADTNIINNRKTGLPTEAGEYSVFVIYENEPVAAFNLKLSGHGLYADLTEKQMSYTYGTPALTSDDIKFNDFNGNVVEDAGVKQAGIFYTAATELTAAQSRKIKDGKYNGQTVYTRDGKNYLDSRVQITLDTAVTPSAKNLRAGKDAAGNAVQFLDAGVYIAHIYEDGATKVAKDGYSVQHKEFLVSVAQKQITSKMFLIYPKQYANGSSVTITNNSSDIVCKDAAVNLTIPNPPTFDVTNGSTSESAVGEYEIELQASNANQNYTGKVTAKWKIVAKGQEMAALKMIDTKTTIYNNGMIHFEIERPADSQFSNGVDKYGVIIEKSGLIDAPDQNAAGLYPKTAAEATTMGVSDAQFANAEKALQVGAGFKQGQQSDKLRKENPTKYGGNIAVTSVDTGAWFRPYVIDGKGNVYYGKAVYVNLVQEATEHLQLKMADKQASTEKTKVTTKDQAKEGASSTVLKDKSWRDDVTSGYSEKNAMYYVYGSYTIKEGSNVKTDAVQKFGVVVDKTGAFDALTSVTPGSTAEAELKQKVKDGLKLGKGFIEGQGGSNKMDVDEYGAMINPANGITGVWVRAYVNLGNNLIVYTDPIYIEDQSTIYDGDTLLTSLRMSYTTDVHDITVTPATFGTNTKKKAAGVIVDLSGQFVYKNADGDYVVTGTTPWTVADEKGLTGENKAAAKMILGNGFIQNQKATTGQYEAHVTPNTYAMHTGTKANVPIVVRPFAVYTIAGHDVTLYGAPVVSTDND